MRERAQDHEFCVAIAYLRCFVWTLPILSAMYSHCLSQASSRAVPTVTIMKPHGSLSTWQVQFCVSHTSMQLMPVKWHRNGSLWDFGLHHVRKQYTSYSHTWEGHVVVSPPVHGQESSLPFPVFIFLHLGEERRALISISVLGDMQTWEKWSWESQGHFLNPTWHVWAVFVFLLCLKETGLGWGVKRKWSRNRKRVGPRKTRVWYWMRCDVESGFG